MRKISQVILLSLSALGNFGLSAQVLPLATGEWPPYTSEKMAEQGITTELVTSIVKEMGLMPQYRFYPWLRAEKALQEGETFAAFPYAPTKKRSKDFYFSDTILKSRFVFFYKKTSLKQPLERSSLENLKQYRVGVVLGMAFAPDLEKAGLQIAYVLDEEQNFKKLYMDRIDLIPTDELLGWWIIERLYPNERHLFETSKDTFPFPMGDSRLMISRSYPNALQLRDQFNQALRRIKTQKTYREILTKYGLNSE